MNMDECIIVASIIDKIPPPRKDFKKSFKHKKKETTFKEWGNYLCIEEEYRM